MRFSAGFPTGGDAIALGIQGKAQAEASVFLEKNRAQVAELDVKAPKGTVVYIRRRRRG